MLDKDKLSIHLQLHFYNINNQNTEKYSYWNKMDSYGLNSYWNNFKILWSESTKESTQSQLSMRQI